MKHLTGFALAFFLLAASGAFAFSREALDQVDRSVTFIELQQNPDSFIGRELMLGGVIISLEKRRSGGMQLEVAQLPLSAADLPMGNYKPSGRFLVTIPDELDRREYRPGMLVTVIGAVRNSAKVIVDGEESVFPVLAVQEMQLWPEPRVERRPPSQEVVVYERQPETVYVYENREPYYYWPYYYAPLFPWWFGASFTYQNYPSHYYRPYRYGHAPGHGSSHSGGGGGHSPRRDR